MLTSCLVNYSTAGCLHSRSLEVQFQEDVYKNVGASEILPHLIKCLDADKILAVQFLRAGKVRLTFDDPEVCSAVLRNGLELEGLSVQLMPADDRFRCVYLRDIPVEVDDDVVSSFLSRYGEVLSVDHCYFDDFPSLRNGNRLVKILLAQDIPSFVRVESCECRVWYPRQPPQCSICREFGHRALTCPLSSLCRCCRQPGHVARECAQAWGPSVSLFSPASDGSSDESDHAMKQSSPRPFIVPSVPFSAQSTPSSVPRSSPKGPAVSVPVSVPAQSVTVSAAPATITVCASPIRSYRVCRPCYRVCFPRYCYRTCSCYSNRFLCYGYRFCSYSSYCACFLPLDRVLLPRCLILLLLLPVIAIFLSFLVIRILLTASRGLISGNV